MASCPTLLLFAFVRFASGIVSASFASGLLLKQVEESGQREGTDPKRHLPVWFSPTLVDFLATAPYPPPLPQGAPENGIKGSPLFAA